MKQGYDEMKKTICVFLSFLLAALCALPVCAAEDLTITNPYAAVDWDTWGAYKAQLHCHTTASDGYLTIRTFLLKSCVRTHENPLSGLDSAGRKCYNDF